MTAKCASAETPGCEALAPHPGVCPWLKLVAGFILIWALIFGIGSLAQLLPGAKRMAQVIDERGLRATAVYYTDFEEPAEGSERIRDSLDYKPRSDR
jgi:hypothetical protein